jgi:hypothetical protein
VEAGSADFRQFPQFRDQQAAEMEVQAAGVEAVASEQQRVPRDGVRRLKRQDR